jgi:hypothetical protein
MKFIKLLSLIILLFLFETTQINAQKNLAQQ